MLAYYVISIVAIFLGTILAVQAQKYIELRREVRCLGFEFDEVHIRRGGNIPVGLYNIEEEQHLIRREIAKILKGESSFPMKVTDFPLIVDDATTEDAVRKILPEIIQRLGIEAKITGLSEVVSIPMESLSCQR